MVADTAFAPPAPSQADGEAGLLQEALSPVEFFGLLGELALPTGPDDVRWIPPSRPFRQAYKLSGRGRALVHEGGAIRFLWDRSPDRFAVLVPRGHGFRMTMVAVRLRLASSVPVPADPEAVALYARWLERRAAEAGTSLHDDVPGVELLAQLLTFMLCHSRQERLDGVRFDTPVNIVDRVVVAARSI